MMALFVVCCKTFPLVTFDIGASELMNCVTLDDVLCRSEVSREAELNCGFSTILPVDEVLPIAVEGHSQRVVSKAGCEVNPLGSSGVGSELEVIVDLVVSIDVSGFVVVVDVVVTAPNFVVIVVVVRSEVSAALEIGVKSSAVVTIELNDGGESASETCGECAFELRVCVDSLVYCLVLRLTSPFVSVCESIK